MADDGFREQVRDATEIADLIGEQIALRPVGPGRFAGLCPFHKETAPSFQVNAERGFFHCFGCKESGDVFSFLMKRDGLTFVESLHTLARRAGIPIPTRNPERASRQEALRAANRKALQFFRAALTRPAGKKALRALRGRGLSDATITEYGLGYATGEWDDLSRALGRDGVPMPIRIEVGLVLEGRRSGHFDFFRNRLIVPILDGSGRVVSFAGRSLDGKEPKYLNTRETPIYRKYGVLYGFNHARTAIRRERQAILMEGYFDCLSAWQAGVPNAVAVCGTALTPQHAKLLAAQTRDVVLAFDSDPGGRRAARKAVGVLLEAGIRVRVARFGNGRDPDDLVREEGGAALREAVRVATGFVDFLVAEALEGPSGAGNGRADAARGILEVIARAPSPLDRETWLAEVAGGLGFSLDAARAELARVAGRATMRRGPDEPRRGDPRDEEARDPREASGDSAARGPLPAERELIRWIGKRPDEVTRILCDAAAEDFEGLALAPAFLDLKAVAEAGEDLPTRLAELSSEPGPIQRVLVAAQMDPVGLDLDRQTPADCFGALRLRALRLQLGRIKGEVRRGGPTELFDRLREITVEIDGLLTRNFGRG